MAILDDDLRKKLGNRRGVGRTRRGQGLSPLHFDFNKKRRERIERGTKAMTCTNYIRSFPIKVHSLYAGFIAQTILFIEAKSTGTPEVVHGLKYNSKLRDIWDDKIG